MQITIPDWQLPGELANRYRVSASNIFNSRGGECIAYVFDDDDWVYFALEFDGGIIAFEHSPDDYPAARLFTYKTMEQWKQAIARTHNWVYDAIVDQYGDDASERWPALAGVDWAKEIDEEEVPQCK